MMSPGHKLLTSRVVPDLAKLTSCSNVITCFVPGWLCRLQQWACITGCTFEACTRTPSHMHTHAQCTCTQTGTHAHISPVYTLDIRDQLLVCLRDEYDPRLVLSRGRPSAQCAVFVATIVRWPIARRDMCAGLNQTMLRSSQENSSRRFYASSGHQCSQCGNPRAAYMTFMSHLMACRCLSHSDPHPSVDGVSSNEQIPLLLCPHHNAMPGNLIEWYQNIVFYGHVWGRFLGLFFLNTAAIFYTNLPIQRTLNNSENVCRSERLSAE